MSKACQDKCLVFEVTSVSSNIWYIFIVCIRSYLHFTAKAVPRIHPVTLEPGRVGESVALNCSVSYDNDNFQAEYNLILSWIKNGNVLATKNVNYMVGSHTEEIIHSVVVNSSRDGGDYVCHWTLMDKNRKANFILENYTVVLPSKLLHLFITLEIHVLCGRFSLV
jgi:hypothetical protein